MTRTHVRGLVPGSLPWLAAFFALLLPDAGAAQFGSRGFGANAGYYGWSGDAVEGLEGGLRVRGTAFAELSPSLAFGLGGHYGWDGLEGTDEDLRDFGFSAVVRWSPGFDEGTRFFLDGSVGWSRLTVDRGRLTAIAENGVSLGPRIGVEIPIADDIRLVFSGDAFYHKYGDIPFVEGAVAGGPGSSGWRWGVDVGLLFDGGS